MSKIPQKLAAFFKLGDEFVRRGGLEAAGVDFLGEAEERALVAFEKLKAKHRLKGILGCVEEIFLGSATCVKNLGRTII